MKRLIAILGIFMCVSPVNAASYTVKAGGGGSFTTISACAATAVAGDSCVVYAGTYSETPSLSTSGSSGSPITFSVNPGDCVTVTGFNLNSVSYVTIGTPNGSHCTNGSFTYSGFEITGSPISWTQIHNVIIQNNYIHAAGDICLRGPGTNASGASTFVYVLNNTLTLCGGSGLAGGILVEGDHWLIDSNTISHVEDGVYLYGANMVVRNNHFGPITAAEEGSNHPDAIESSCSGDFPLQHMLFENNTVQDWRSADAHLFLMRDVNMCGMTNNIIRLSVALNIGADWTANDSYSLKTYSYNNSDSQMELDSGKAFSSYTFNDHDTGNVVKNFIQQDSWDTGGPDYCLFADSTSQPVTEGGNICYLSTGSVTWNAPWSGGSYDGSDQLNANPLYVNSSSNLHLQSGSPAINAGVALTTAVGAGSASTSLTVADAGYFSNGYGITGVQADWIRIGASTTVQISSINYSTNVITLASSKTWSNGASIYLYKDSSGNIVLSTANPNIGAFPGGTPPPPPVVPSIRRSVVMSKLGGEAIGK